ncbi:Uncharacterised protein [Mycobacterium tuberculosis]|nr:Uncharacterised protein [Mycobacterium tuberculosis]
MVASAFVIDVNGMSAANAHPILTCRLPAPTHSSLFLGPSPSGTASGRNQRSKRNWVGTKMTLPVLVRLSTM